LLRFEDRLAPAVFTVINTNEMGGGSLRDAVLNANADAVADTINFAALFDLPQVIKLATAISITNPVTIDGPVGRVTVSGSKIVRMFDVAGAGAIAVTLRDLNFVNGVAAGGGAVRVGDENLTVENCSFTDNQSTTTGGAIEVGIGSVTLTNCTLSGNLATDPTGDGGAIRVGTGGDVIIDRCHIFGNTSGRDGGAIAFSKDGKYVITNSTLSGNVAARSGGGLSFVGTPEAGSLVRNSTFSGNSAGYMGGGIHVGTFAGVLLVQNCTITGNGLASKGGGIARSSGAGDITAESSIISLNMGGTGANIYTTGTVNLTKCAVTNVGFGGGVFGVNIANIFAGDLKLGPLGDYGGSAPTHTLLDGSVCLNVGSNPAALASDERGTGFPRNANGAPDIGAFESPQKYVVDTLVDENDANFGPGDFSLREAIGQANASGVSQDRISFSVNGVIALGLGELGITDSLLIDGPGEGKLTISGGFASRIFNVAVTSGNVQYVSFYGVTLQFGKAGAGQGGGAIQVDDEELRVFQCTLKQNQADQTGGAIRVNKGELPITLLDSDFVNNFSTSGGGGAVMINGTGHPVSVDLCKFDGNTAPLDGGAIVVVDDSTLTLRTSTFSNNQSTGATGDGAFCYFVNGGDLDVEGCTISGNKSGDDGGGIVFTGIAADGVISIRNSTISGNTAVDLGGGVLVQSFTGSLAVWNSTVTNNTTAGSGGGIARDGATGLVTLESTIVSGNTAKSAASGHDISCTAGVEVKNSAIGNTGGFPIVDKGGNLLNQSPAMLKLGVLADNGGPTLTHLPAKGSPLIDAGTNPAALTSDQRGSAYPRVSGTQSDIGAVEVQRLIVSNAKDSGLGSLRQAILDANTINNPQDIEFDVAFFNVAQTITLTTGELLITDSVTIAGPAAPLTIDGNKNSRIFNIDGPGILEVYLYGLTITNGNAGGVGTEGGGIRIGDESVTLDHFMITNCTAGDGGGIRLDGTNAKLMVDELCIAANTATNPAGGGGGISGLGAAGICIAALDSMISDNTSAGHGGGIAMSSGMLKLLNTTISGNKASGNGGGVAVSGGDSGGPLELQNCTITNNSSMGKGGGIYSNNPGILDLESCIVAGNINSAAPDISNTVAGRLKRTAIGSGLGFTYSDLGGNLPFGIDLKLAPLADNGGPTPTHALMPFSPCLEKGSNPASLTTDQRGPGYSRLKGMAPDIGAYENQNVTPAAKVINVVINDGEVQRSKVREIEVMFDQIIGPNEITSAFQLKRHSDGAMVMLNGIMSSSGMSVILSFAGGPAVEIGSLADGRYDLSITASKVLNASGQPLDGNGDGMGGDDYMLMGDPATNKLFRLFGDSDGNGTVNSSDFAVFRSYFGLGMSVFDYDGDNQTNSNDFAQFRKRFGLTI